MNGYLLPHPCSVGPWKIWMKETVVCYTGNVGSTGETKRGSTSKLSHLVQIRYSWNIEIRQIHVARRKGLPVRRDWR
jgi:hypothetical protein